MVFDPWCPSCERRFLVGYRSLKAFGNTEDGIVLVFSCPNCGGDALIVTGKHVYDPERMAAHTGS